MEESGGWKRGRKVSGAVLEREGRAWWAPNEQIMTGSILQDGVTPPPPHPPLPLLRSSSLLFSLWQFNFPLSPPCSCLLIVSEALSLGPPSTLGPRYLSVWERRLECQNVIWDSEQPERRRSHTIRPDVHLNAPAQGTPPLTGCTHKKTRKQRSAEKRWFINLRIKFCLLYLFCMCDINDLFMPLVSGLKQRLQWRITECQLSFKCMKSLEKHWGQ